MVAKVVPMCLRALLDMARLVGCVGGLLIGEQRGPTHFQQPPTLLQLRPVKGLPPGPGPE